MKIINYLLMKLDDYNIIRLDDPTYIKYKFNHVLGKNIDLSNPTSFNEKLNYLKLYDHNLMYSNMVDKYEAKRLIEESKFYDKKICNVIPTIGIYDKFEDINFDKLPSSFVIKCTHDSGSYKIITDKRKINYSKLKRFFNKHLNSNFYYRGREWPYKNVKPRIIIEKLIRNNHKKGLVDYKFQCFNGKVDNVLICMDRNKRSGVKYLYYDKKFNYLPYSKKNYGIENISISKPKHFEDMIKIAEHFSKGLPELRVDFYLINNQIYFSEFTFYTNGGFDNTITEEADLLLGSRLKINMRIVNAKKKEK